MRTKEMFHWGFPRKAITQTGCNSDSMRIYGYLEGMAHIGWRLTFAHSFIVKDMIHRSSKARLLFGLLVTILLASHWAHAGWINVDSNNEMTLNQRGIDVELTSVPSGIWMIYFFKEMYLHMVGSTPVYMTWSYMSNSLAYIYRLSSGIQYHGEGIKVFHIFLKHKQHMIRPGFLSDTKLALRMWEVGPELWVNIDNHTLFLLILGCSRTVHFSFGSRAVKA